MSLRVKRTVCFTVEAASHEMILVDLNEEERVKEREREKREGSGERIKVKVTVGKSAGGM